MSSPAADAGDAPELAAANIRLDGRRWVLEAQVVRDVGDCGGSISCKAGCGACCRMLVPISELEAQRLREVVHAMPEPRRSHVLARFAEAVRQLDAAGLLPQLRRVEQWTDNEFQAMTRAYFERQIACPFLEAESCSIYEERPITCREYLVTSPAEKCARPAGSPCRCSMRWHAGRLHRPRTARSAGCR
jgi:Fe-S-cluster containining protein